jgi:hypothetical protein
MRIESVKVGMRVAVVLSGKVVSRDTVYKIYDDGAIEVGPWRTHSENLRRLVPRKKPRTWTMEQIGKAWDATVGRGCDWDNSVASNSFKTALEAQKP